jgi:hypothetical protein
MDGRQHKRMLLRIVHQLKLHQECYCRKYREDLGSGFFEDGTAASIPTQRKCLARPQSVQIYSKSNPVVSKQGT